MADNTGSTAQSEAQRMVDALASVGVTQFDIAHTNIDQEKRGYRRAQTLRQTKTSLPYLLDSAPRRQNNVILRPHHPPAVVLVQLDDLEQEQLERVRPAAFLVLQTSPGNHQAWVAVEGGDREFASRLKKGTHADLTASGSVRVAGSFNYKRKYAPNFPTVTIEEAHPGRIMTRAELEGRDLVAPAPPKPEAPASPFDVLTGRAVWHGQATSAAWMRRCTVEGSAAAPTLRFAASPLTFSNARRKKPPRSYWRCRARRGKTGRLMRWTKP